MTKTEYLMQMYLLRNELERAASAEPYDPGAHADVVAKINNLNRQWSKTLAKRHRIKTILCIAAILFMLYLVYLLLSELLQQS